MSIGMSGTSLQQQYQDLANQVTLAASKLDRLEADFDAKVESGDLPLNIFQAMESEIRWQSRVVETLEKRRNAIEQAYADEQRQLAAEQHRQELILQRQKVIAQLHQIDLDIPACRQEAINLGMKLASLEQMRNSLLQEYSRNEDAIHAAR